jgi:O-antigen/teichoic acid export membrane protein
MSLYPFSDSRQMQLIKPLSLRRNFSWTFTGNLVYAGSQWGMLVLLAKLGSPEMVGQFTLGLAVTAPVMMFTNLQLRGIQATDARREYSFNDYLALRLLGTVLAFLIITGITLTSGYPSKLSLVILVIGFSKGIESISDVFYGLIQQHERMDWISISSMIKGILSLLMLDLGMILTHSVLGGTIGLAIAWTLVLVCYDIPRGIWLLKISVKKQEEELENSSKKSKDDHGNLPSPTIFHLWQPHWHWKRLSKLTWLALPLGLVMMLISLNTNIPRYFIEHSLGVRELGIFGALSYLMVAGSMVVGALGQSASPKLAKYYAAGNKSGFEKLIWQLMGIGFLLGVVGVLVALVGGKPLLTLIYGSEYAQNLDVFVWLMVATGIGYMSSFQGYTITAARYFRIQMPLFALVTGISAISCLFLIPYQGLRGASIALVISALVQFALSSGVTYHAIYTLPRYSVDS